MSRIGKKIIEIPDKVKLDIVDGLITVQGPKGELKRKCPEGITFFVNGRTIEVKRKNDSRRYRSLHGLMRTLVANMVRGVSEGFEKKLEITGLGLKANVQGQKLNLSLGFSHPVVIDLPMGISANVDANTKITLSGADNEILGVTAAHIRKLRLPEPYKGTGIKYAGEVIIRKVGKTTGAGAS